MTTLALAQGKPGTRALGASDDDTGWRYNAARVYDPRVGRWTSQDPAGFAAGDANLYRYAANAPVNSWDPTGLAGQDDKPRLSASKDGSLGVETGKLYWPLTKPDVPKAAAKLNLYTYLDMSWEIKKAKEKEKPREGSYRFWVKGLVLPGAKEGDKTGTLEFNLSPFHGSHMGGENKRPEWPIFKGKNRKERAAQSVEYLKNAFNLKDTIGTLKVRIEFRAYKDAPKGFNDRLTSEMPGPFEKPGTTKPINAKDPDELRRPNRLRNSIRTLGPWTAEQPKFWAIRPEWKYTIDLEYKWDYSGKEFKGTYTQSYDGKKTKGTTPYPKK
jgi:RHS repeat-associated protein